MNEPDSTAVRVALWRALHVLVDPPPHVLDDVIGLELAAPAEGWRNRPDMNPEWTSRMRASIVARARFIEDLVEAQPNRYVILGAGLDTFAQRKPQIASRIGVFEVDRPGPQAWKQQRLRDLGYGLAPWLHFVPVDFEKDEGWLQRVVSGRPAVIASSGVSMYLTRDAITAMLRQIATLARGSTFVMSFLQPIDLIEPEMRSTMEMAMKGAQSSGTPFVSFFSPDEICTLAREAGFAEVQHVSAGNLAERYFAGRTDGLRPSNGEELIVAR